jgi:hypothetical protein
MLNLKKEDYWDLVSCGYLIKRVIPFEIKHEIGLQISKIFKILI